MTISYEKLWKLMKRNKMRKKHEKKGGRAQAKTATVPSDL